MAEKPLDQTEGASHYRVLVEEVASRWRRPWGHPSFVIYFILAVFGFGGTGLWVEVYSYFSADVTPSVTPLRTALTTLFPAIAGATALQLIWAENRRSLRACASLFLAILLLSAVFVTAADSRVGNFWSLTFGILSSIAAYWVWWITNANQKDLLDDIDPDAPIGGNREAVKEQKLSGSLTGIEH